MATYTGIVSMMAECTECEWRKESRNALGLAGIHHKKTGHTVHVDIYNAVTFARDGSEYHKAHEAKHKKSQFPEPEKGR